MKKKIKNKTYDGFPIFLEEKEKEKEKDKQKKNFYEDIDKQIA